MLATSVEFLTPLAGLVALLCLVPLAAFVRARVVARRRRAAVGLSEPRRRAYLLPLAAVLAAAVALGLAAMQPVVSFDETRRVRTDAEAYIVIDTTRSMLARAAPGSPQRIARAKAIATLVEERAWQLSRKRL